MASLAHQPSTPTSANQAIEVAVVGAGLSGLHCCKTILENSKRVFWGSLGEAQGSGGPKLGGRMPLIFRSSNSMVFFARETEFPIH